MVPSRYLKSYPSTRDIGEPLLDLHREMNRLFDEVVRNSFWPLTAAQQAAQQAVQQGLTAQQAVVQQSLVMAASPRVDLQESDQDLLVTVDLPGVQQSDVEVKVEGDTLIICGEKRSSNEQKQQNFHLMERSYGRFERAVPLPFSPNPEQAEARYEDGVLTVRLPKEEEQCSHRIEVQQGRIQSRESRESRGREQQGQYLSDRDRERAGANVQFSAESQSEPSTSGSSRASTTASSGGSSSPSSSSGSGQGHKASTDRKQPQPA